MRKVIKTAILITVFLLAAGCNHVVLRQDLYEKVAFKSEKIKPGKNTIELYSLEFPKSYFEKLKYMEEFEVVSKQLLLEDKSLNLLLSRAMYDTIDSLKKGEVLPEEKIYLKTASDLDSAEMSEIDREIDVYVTDRGGSIQEYLNKQVYFWMVLNGKKSEFIGENLYTELDKQRLVEEIRKSRKEFSRVLNNAKMNLIIKEKDPYAVKNTEFSTSESADVFNPTDLPKWVLSEKEPIYLQGVKDGDFDKISEKEVKFNSPFVILDSEKFTGYTVVEGNYIFFYGGSDVKSSYHRYDFEVKISEVTLKDLFKAESGILLDELFDRKKPEINGIEKKATQPDKKSVNWGIN
ncbi:hypothetical protein [uncultured Ilyobacter sp.]|uniref:hypothetical protein n=1 Tax=uncultured Ilyobacter sp. TaxID=544433 RepID=UPI0029F56947|nr:hypothetical protein [uncultured Ilyobacter sp.]